ncbi:hypothetical protein PVAP13_9KG151255 [Panicum virgatum]|uniref:Secreted protein n=1 Tax=Panicum virgatum TaxID=38727 RepID=A0A8T0NIW8_PANVG|nr:hypothetical protein PVAP13_9KG151255 [Panicum virgatum]
MKRNWRCLHLCFFSLSPIQSIAHLYVQENELVLVRNMLLPTATFIKLQPHTTDFLHAADLGPGLSARNPFSPFDPTIPARLS